MVYSKEQPLKPKEEGTDGFLEGCICPPGNENKCGKHRAIPGSMVFVPAVAGLIAASEVIKDLIK